MAICEEKTLVPSPIQLSIATVDVEFEKRISLSSSTMAVNFLSTKLILLIFLLKSNGEDSVDAFTPFGYVPSRVRSKHTQLHVRASDRHDYNIDANSDPNVNDACTFTEDQIHHLIAKRLECKKRRNFEDADRILEALNKNGIYIQDKARKFRVDGENHFGRRKHYVQRGGNYGGKENLAEVEELVEERARYKRMRDYFRSDEVTSVLRDKYRVRVDDRRREWSFIEQNAFEEKKKDAKDTPVEFYVPTPLAPKDHATHTMDDETKDYIRDQLMERSIARKSKDYKTADRLLEALTTAYFIVVDDRTKEWKVISTDDSYFDDTENDPFVKEATLSQRSAFVQTTRGNDTNDRNFNRAGDSDGWFSNRDDSLEDELSRIIDNDDADKDWDDASSDEETSAVNESLDQVEEISAVEETVEEPSGETADDLTSLTVVALKEKLRMAGLPVSGRKQELIDRILSASLNE